MSKNKSKSLYTTQGYLDVEGIVQKGYPFNFIWGGRGTGKTYGGLKYVVEHNKTFMYSRTKQTQLDKIKNVELSPFKPLNADNDWNIQPFPVDDIAGFYRTELNEKDRLVPVGSPVGYASAITTLANLRGFSAEDVSVWIWDEFIPQKGDRVPKGIATSFLHGYETMNRNRELKGLSPLQVLCFSNSDNVGCELFASLGLIRKVADMSRKHQETAFLRDRGIALYNLCNSPISQAKQNTALYKMVGKDSGFSQMALGNEFYNTDYSDVRTQNLSEYLPLVFFEEIAIYEHKSSDMLYVCKHKQGEPIRTFIGINEKNIKAFKRYYSWIWNINYLEDKIYFEDIESKFLLDSYFHM